MNREIPEIILSYEDYLSVIQEKAKVRFMRTQ